MGTFRNGSISMQILTFVLGLAVAIFGRLEVSAEASHFAVRGLDTARGHYRGAFSVVDTFFGYHCKEKGKQCRKLTTPTELG